MKRNKVSFLKASVLSLTKHHCSLLRFVSCPTHISWLMKKKDDQIMRTKSHSCVHFIYLNLHSMPPDGFSPPYKELVVGQVEPSGVKSGDNLFFWPHCLSNLPTGCFPPNSGLYRGPPVSFPVTCVVNKPSPSPMPLSASDPQNRMAVPHDGCGRLPSVWHHLYKV